MRHDGGERGGPRGAYRGGELPRDGDHAWMRNASTPLMSDLAKTCHLNDAKTSSQHHPFGELPKAARNLSR